MIHVHKVRAEHDDECQWCGYPFDTGDECLSLDAEGEMGVLCGIKCVMALAQRLTDLAWEPAWGPVHQRKDFVIVGDTEPERFYTGE